MERKNRLKKDDRIEIGEKAFNNPDKLKGKISKKLSGKDLESHQETTYREIYFVII